MEKDSKLIEELFIFERMVEGDQKALRFFFDKYYDELCHFVNAYIHFPEIAEEIVQDIFIHLWENRDDLKLNYSIKSFLYQATKNRSLNFIRNEQNRRVIQDKILHETSFETSINESYLDSDQLRQIIDAAIQKLPPRCKEIYNLCKNKHLTYKEVAVKLGIAEKTVENQMVISLHKLRTSLQPYYDKIVILMIINILESIFKIS